MSKKKQKSTPTTPSIWDPKKLDNLHFTWDRPLAYGKTWNFAIGERESGKSVNSWIKLFNAFYYRNRPSLVLRRRIADITSAYIDDTATLLNKFLLPEYQIQLLYLKGDVNSGIADIKVGQAGQSYSYAAIKQLPTFFRIIGLSCPMNRIKSLLLRDVQYIFFDEMLANTRAGEKYLSGDEHFLISEIYTTYNREASTPIRILAAGNPYSVYCPLFSGLGVDSSKLKPGAFVIGPSYIIDCFQVPPELKDIILRNNPMYQFDDAYKRYAFNGESINDQNIRLHKCEPRAFKLKWTFKIGNDFITVHRGTYKDNQGTAKYWICAHKSDWLGKVSKRRKIIVFDFGDLINGAVKWGTDDRLELIGLKDAMNKRQVMYNSVDASYMMEDISMYF